MKDIKELVNSRLNFAKPISHKTERGDLFDYFLSRINPSRLRDGYPTYTHARLGIRLKGIATKDLYYLKSVCDDSPNFSKRFFWELNPKKHEETQAPNFTKPLFKA